MKIYIFIFLISISLLLFGCKSNCNNCTKVDANKAQQIEQNDHYIPWWVKSK